MANGNFETIKETLIKPSFVKRIMYLFTLLMTYIRRGSCCMETMKTQHRIQITTQQQVFNNL